MSTLKIGNWGNAPEALQAPVTSERVAANSEDPDEPPGLEPLE